MVIWMMILLVLRKNEDEIRIFLGFEKSPNSKERSFKVIKFRLFSST